MRDLAAALHAEARRANERRLLVLAGPHDVCVERLTAVLDATGLAPTLVGHRDIDHGGEPLPRYQPRDAGALLGTTHDSVVLDCHDECRPNALGRAVGAVDGGGLLVLLTPALDAWPDRHDRFDDHLAVPPFDPDDVTGHFRRRLVGLLRQHPGIAVVDAATGTVERDGLTDPEPAAERPRPTPPTDREFPAAAYERCLTDDQASAVRALEALRSGGVVVVEADRGRGKSSAAGLAGGSLAEAGRTVVVTAPDARGTDEVFARARELLAARDALAADEPRHLRTTAGGSVRYLPPTEAASADADAVVVDEAAGLPVALLESFLDAPAVAYTTTVHGYEGAGRGFSVRFRERLDASGRDVTEHTLAAPIRYAADDPVETWAFRALLLDARPAVDAAVEDATVEGVTYQQPTPEGLVRDEYRLRELFGLLVLAHYRTQPDDLARLLDAPNLHTRALTHHGRVVAVALLAREGGLDDDACAAAYRGGRIQGNMVPDLLTGQLRDPDGAAPKGLRTVRIAVHHAVRDRGLGSALLDAVHVEFADEVDYFSVGYGATPRLLRFWAANGYRTVHLSTTRNGTSGEHSAAMLRPAGTDAGDALCERHGRWFRERIGDVLTDSLRDLDADVVRGALAATDPTEPALPDREWALVVSMTAGPGQFDMYPGPFRRLALAALTATEPPLDADAERLLVRRVLQGWGWERVAEALDLHSASGARKALGRAYGPLVERWGGAAAATERARLEDG